MPHNKNSNQEELKNNVVNKYFLNYDYTKKISGIKLCISKKESLIEPLAQENLLWAEAKKEILNIEKNIVQLVLKIGKDRTFDNHLPPRFLGIFDAKKIVFISYNNIHDIFYLNDFNWNSKPTNSKSKEFQLILGKVKHILNENSLIFYFKNNDEELRKFISTHFKLEQKKENKIPIDKNNFVVIFNKWLKEVKPSIAINWELVNENGFTASDFYLSDLLVSEEKSLQKKLLAIVKSLKNKENSSINKINALNLASNEFNDQQKAHKQFWSKYQRPKKEEFWEFIVNKHEILVPQDVRERKGSFFTPQIWVELSQKYLSDSLGKNWQDEYYIWDCATGTGNLLNGLTNKKNIWASTIDSQDVEVIKECIKNGANLLKDHVFQFDFLNDDLKKLPKPLLDIINNPVKRKKLIFYINPPYAESNGRKTKDRSHVKNTKTYTAYYSKLKKVGAELFAQFLMRIYSEIPDSIIAQFSTFKAISGTNSMVFREHFLAQNKSCFAVPANTFDNVKGKFPIGFFIWDTSKKVNIEKITAKIYQSDGSFFKTKNFYTYDNEKRINSWLKVFKTNESKNGIAYLMADAPDFQNNNFISILNTKSKRHGINFLIDKSNLFVACIYLSVRHCMQATWLNDRDQFLYPNNKWREDMEFQLNCLVYTLFHGQNKITSKLGTNHWIPFNENEINSKEKFESNFMSHFINDTLKINKLEFSKEALNVFNSGKKLWKYYYLQERHITNASFYDIRDYFQGRTPKGRMNSKSEDKEYTKLITDLRTQLKMLAQKIESKVFEYGFLKE